MAALAAYHNSFAGPFIYDDVGAITENRTIRQLWPIWQVLSPPHEGQTVSGRPLLNVSLAINYALGGLEVWGYHATNLAIHIAAALLLFGILRRTLLMPTLRDRFGGAATPLALAVALLWIVHPLQTESVTYIIQRAESLMGLFYLLTLYCVIRGAGTVPLGSAGKGTVPFSLRENRDSPRLWYVAAVLACLLGMACKEVMVTAPLLVLLYDRTFLAGSFIEAWRRRWGLYVGLAATWGLLGYLVFSTGLIARQPEMGAPDPWTYARTQPDVILHYLQLSVWPNPLCLDYEWPVADRIDEVLPGALVVGLLLALTIWGVIRRRAWGLLGAWFFLILAPTSSILPLGELAYDHRMYLSLAAVLVLAVVGGCALWERLLRRLEAAAAKKGTVPGRATLVRWVVPVVVWTAVLLALGYATTVRNRDYRSWIAIWQHTVDKHPHSSFARNNLGMALATAGRPQEAIEQYREALRLKPKYANVHNNLGIALAVTGKFSEAIGHFHQALQWGPDSVETHNNLGSALLSLGKPEEALAEYNKALRLNPDDAEARSNLGSALLSLGKPEEAIQQYQEALRLKPDHAEAHNYLGKVLATRGRTEDAIAHYQQALRLKPQDAGIHNNLGNALLAAGQLDKAIQRYREALRLKPDFAEAHNNLAFALSAVGTTDEAIEHYNQALQIKPDDSSVHYNLANALAQLGRTSEAIEHYREALRLTPDYAEAHNNLGATLAALGKTDEAIEHYRKALLLRGDSADTHYNLAVALAKVDMPEEASEHYNQVLRLKPDFTMARFNLAGTLAASGKTDEAIEHYNQLVQQMPDSVDVLNNLAWLLATGEGAQGGDPARAVQLAQRARELSGQENAQCLDTLAAAYAAAGRFSDAIITAQRAAEVAQSVGQMALARNIQSRLELYRAGQPYRETPRAAEKNNP